MLPFLLLCSVFQDTSRMRTSGQNRLLPSWRSPWCFSKMWLMGLCTRVLRMELTPLVHSFSTCIWYRDTLISATSITPGCTNTLHFSTGQCCLVRPCFASFCDYYKMSYCKCFKISFLYPRLNFVIINAPSVSKNLQYVLVAFIFLLFFSFLRIRPL